MNPTVTSDITIEGFELNYDNDTAYIWYFHPEDPQDSYREFTVDLDKVREWIRDNIEWADGEDDIYLKEEFDFNDQEGFVEQWLKENKEPELTDNTPEEPVKPPPDSSQYARGGTIYSYSGFLRGVRDTEEISISANQEKGTARVTCSMDYPDNRKAPLHVSRKHMADDLEKFWKDLRPLSTKIQSLSVGFDQIDWYENYGEYTGGSEGSYDVPVFYIKRGLKKVRIEEDYETNVPKEWEIRVSCVFKFTKTKTPYMAFIEGCFGVGFTSTNRKKIEKELRKVLQGKKDSTYIDFRPDYDTAFKKGGEVEPQFDLSDDTYTIALGKISSSIWHKEPTLKKYLSAGGSKLNLWKLKDLSSDDLISLSKTITTSPYEEGGKVKKVWKYEWGTWEAGINKHPFLDGYTWYVDDVPNETYSFQSHMGVELKTPEEAEKDMFNEINDRVGYTPKRQLTKDPSYAEGGEISDKVVVDFMEALEESGMMAKNSHKNEEAIGTIKSIISMPKQEIGKNPSQNVRMIYNEYNDWIQTYADGGKTEDDVQYGSWSITIEEDENDEDLRNEEVARLIKEGYTSGQVPSFHLEITDIEGDLDEASEEHIAELVKQGYTSGEVIIDAYADGGRIGDRVRLIKMEDPYSPVESGTEGTIRLVDDIGQLHIDWDNGRTLAIVPEIDKYELLGDGGNVKTKYVAEADYYVYGDDDKDATREAKKITSEIDDKYDNKARVKHLHQQSFGTLGSRQVFDDGGEIREINLKKLSKRDFVGSFEYESALLIRDFDLSKYEWNEKEERWDEYEDYAEGGEVFGKLNSNDFEWSNFGGILRLRIREDVWDELFKSTLKAEEFGNATDWIKSEKMGKGDSKFSTKMYSPSLNKLRNQTAGEFYGRKEDYGQEIIETFVATHDFYVEIDPDMFYIKNKQGRVVGQGAWDSKKPWIRANDIIPLFTRIVDNTNRHLWGKPSYTFNPFTIEKESGFYVIKDNRGVVLAKAKTQEGIMKEKRVYAPIDSMADGGEVSLFFQQGTSDKEYHIQLEKDNGGYVVNFQYGRRGSALKSGTKTASPVSLEEAQKIYDKLLNSKVAKGYSVYQSTQQQFSGNPVAPKTVHRLPQLLNMVFTAKEFINDDSYLAQEKRDGERRLIVATPNGTMGLNKKGQEVPLPNKIIDSIDDECTLDGEIIGDTLFAFDILELNGKDLEGEPCIERISTLNTLKFGDGVKVVETAYTTQEKQKLFDKLKREHREGIVFKKKDAPYTHGRPHSGGNQLKYKFYKTATFIVANITPGKRSVGLELLDNGNRVFMGKVTIPPNKDIPNVGDFVEVRYLYAYKGGAIFQPTYLSKREDSDLTDATLDQIIYKSDKMAWGGGIDFAGGPPDYVENEKARKKSADEYHESIKEWVKKTHPHFSDKEAEEFIKDFSMAPLHRYPKGKMVKGGEVKRGTIVAIKPEHREPGEEGTYYFVEEDRGDRVFIIPLTPGSSSANGETIKKDMIEVIELDKDIYKGMYKGMGKGGEVDQVMYHATPSYNRQDILENGLLQQSTEDGSQVWLTYKSGLKELLEDSEEDEDDDAWEVTIPKKYYHKLKSGYDMGYLDDWSAYYDNIPVEWLRLLNKKEIAELIKDKMAKGGKIQDVLNAKYKSQLKDFWVNEGEKGLVLSHIEIKPDKQGMGIATKVMNDLTKYADKKNLIIGTTPSSDYGSSKTRLTEFYKRFGFVNNKGRNKDFAFNNTLIRNPTTYADGGKVDKKSANKWYDEQDLAYDGYSVSDWTPGAWRKMFLFLVDEGFSFEGAKQILLSKHTRWARDVTRGSVPGKSENQLNTFPDWMSYYGKDGKKEMSKMLSEELGIHAEGGKVLRDSSGRPLPPLGYYRSSATGNLVKIPTGGSYVRKGPGLSGTYAEGGDVEKTGFEPYNDAELLENYQSLWKRRYELSIHAAKDLGDIRKEMEKRNLSTHEPNLGTRLDDFILREKGQYASGGEVIGKSHTKGGEKFTVKSTGQLVELEGGEGVLKKSAMDSEKEYTLKGTPKEIASCLNEEYEGVNFRDDGGKCDISQENYASGGSVRHSKGRKGPTDSATWHIEGTKMKGNDGNLWCVSVNKNGIHRWVKCKT